MIPLILVVAAVIPFASIVVDMALDNAGQAPLFLRPQRRIRRQQADEAELQRLSPADLPPERESLLPVDFYDSWPQRQTPSDLPPRVGMVIAEDRPGRHRAPEPEPEPQWNRTTDTFKALVAATWSDEERATISREWWCESCLDDHKDCAGVCACPCTLVEVTQHA